MNKVVNGVQAVPESDQKYLSDYIIDLHTEFGFFSRDIKGIHPVAVRPTYRFRRQNAQSGVFTIHGREVKSIESVQFVGRNRSACLIKCIVPGSVKEKLIRKLYSVGIHKSFLFPSIDGVAETIKSRYSDKYMQRYDQ